MKTKLPVVASLVVSSLLVAGVASAADPAASTPPPPAPSTDEWTAEAARDKVVAHMNVFPSTLVYSLAWDAGAQFKVARDLSAKGDAIALDLRYSWAFLHIPELFGSGSGGDQLAYGNPTVGAHYTRPLDDVVKDLRIYAGAALTAPVLSEPEGPVATSAAIGATSNAYFDAEGLLPGYMAIRLNFGAEIRLTPHVFYRGDLNPVIWAPTRSGPEAEFVLEQSNEIEYRMDFGLGYGLRLQEAFTFTQPDLVSTALEPFVQYTPQKDAFFWRAGFLVALDEPVGFGLDTGKLAVFRVTAGYHFD